MKPRTTKCVKITEHRGNKRFWIEGAELTKSGFIKGDKFNAEFNDKSIMLNNPKNSIGARTVSGRKRKGQTEYMPIIDICCKAVGGSITSTYAHVDFYNDSIKVRTF